MRKMKNSGIDWIGLIPEKWEITRLKNVLKERKENNNPIKTDNILSLTNEKGVIPYSERGNSGNKAKEDLTSYKLAYPDDIVMNSMNVVIGSVGLSKYYGCVSPVYYMLYSNDDKCIRYYNYIFQSNVFQNELKGLGNGILEIRMRIPMEKLNNVVLPVPPIKEQEQIAKFLDEKVTEIDNTIEKTKKTIEDYKKLKNSYVSSAVLRGIDNNLELKDSGIEWIGYIPKSWNICTASKVILSTQNGLSRRDLENSEGNIVLKLKNISPSGFIDYSEVNRIKLTGKEVDTYSLKDGDFLFVRVNGSKSLVGKCAIYSYKEEDVAYNDHIIRVRLNDIINKFYFQYYLLSYSGKQEIENHTMTAAGQFTISGNGLREIKIVLPPIIEQMKIVEYLDKKCKEIDKLIESKEKIVQELEQYKKSVIYEYVTGKKEVK